MCKNARTPNVVISKARQIGMGNVNNVGFGSKEPMVYPQEPLRKHGYQSGGAEIVIVLLTFSGSGILRRALSPLRRHTG